MLYFEKVGIGTRFSTLPGEFNQGLQTNCTEKIDEISLKVKRKLNVDTLIN